MEFIIIFILALPVSVIIVISVDVLFLREEYKEDIVIVKDDISGKYSNCLDGDLSKEERKELNDYMSLWD